MPVRKTAAYLRHLRSQFRWNQESRGDIYAVRWLDAVDAALAELADPASFPTGYALCREAEELGEPLRQKQFGVGRSQTHRLVFRVTASAVEVVAVRSLRQQDLGDRDM